MKVSYAIIITLISFYQIKAQNLEISSKISSDAILLSSKSKDFINGNIGFGTSCSFSIEYLINKKISLGLVPSYMYVFRHFQTSYNVINIPEFFSYKDHLVNSHGFQIPLLLKYNIGDYYLFSQYGLSYFFLSEYKIDIVSYHMNDPDNKNIEQLTHENYDLKTENSFFGHNASCGFGKKFRIRNFDFFTELKYRQDIADWSYQPKTDPDIGEIKFVTHVISLSIGIIFKNDNQ